MGAERNSDARMDLGGWLRSLGLEQYEAIFRENAIDAEVLPDLTDQDLEKLGVLLGQSASSYARLPTFMGSTRAPPRSPFRSRLLLRRLQLMPPSAAKSQ
jgi:hypothetical protein